MPPDYVITTTIPDGPTKFTDEPQPGGLTRERLVRAPNKARAIAHVVADTLTCEVATIDDAMRIASAGGKVEIAED